jgi:DNA-binding NarL/FixJ family response regulator
MAVRILIADDDIAIRRLIMRVIESRPDWSVCGAVCDGEQAVDKAEELRPDLIVLDLAMPHMNGLQAARQIARRQPETPLLLLTVQQVSKELTKEAVLAGFKGAVSKSTGSEVVRAIEMLLNREPYFDSIRADAYRRPA